jgi:HK97 gp10 family phage protein
VSRPGVKSSGFEIVFNRIPEVIAAVEKSAQENVARVAREIEQDAKANAPVQTGYLRESIEAQVEGKSAEVVAGAEYAGFVEFGTYKMPAQPFMSPAIDAHKDGFFDGKRYFPKGSI